MSKIAGVTGGLPPIPLFGGDTGASSSVAQLPAVTFERVGSGKDTSDTSFPVGLQPYSTLVPEGPVRFRAADGTPLADPNITAAERLLLERGDLRGFWLSRIHKDPVARLGLAMWGRPGDLRRAVRASERWGEAERWQPDLNILSRVMLEFMAPSHVPLSPEGAGQLARYWQWLGDAAMDKLREALLDKGVPEAEMDQTLRTIGRAMAAEHVNQIDRDGLCAGPDGHEPGLLSASQVTEYHRRVFELFGLPPATFGGTMLDFMVELQLAVGAGSWLPGADANEP